MRLAAARKTSGRGCSGVRRGRTWSGKCEFSIAVPPGPVRDDAVPGSLRGSWGRDFYLGYEFRRPGRIYCFSGRRVGGLKYFFDRCYSGFIFGTSTQTVMLLGFHVQSIKLWSRLRNKKTISYLLNVPTKLWVTTIKKVIGKMFKKTNKIKNLYYLIIAIYYLFMLKTCLPTSETLCRNRKHLKKILDGC